jgi:hypothetical protein
VLLRHLLILDMIEDATNTVRKIHLLNILVQTSSDSKSWFRHHQVLKILQQRKSDHDKCTVRLNLGRSSCVRLGNPDYHRKGGDSFVPCALLPALSLFI